MASSSKVDRWRLLNPQCKWCGKPCWSFIAGRRIHQKCNLVRAVGGTRSNSFQSPSSAGDAELPTFGNSGTSGAPMQIDTSAASSNQQTATDPIGSRQLPDASTSIEEPLQALPLRLRSLPHPPWLAANPPLQAPSTRACDRSVQTSPFEASTGSGQQSDASATLLQLAGFADAQEADPLLSVPMDLDVPLMRTAPDPPLVQSQHSDQRPEQENASTSEAPLVLASGSGRPVRKRRPTEKLRSRSPPPQPSPSIDEVTHSGHQRDLLPLWLEAAVMFLTYGYAFIPADATSRELAGDILRLTLDGVPHSTIAGNVEQFDLASRITPELRERWHKLVRERATSIGITQAATLKICAEKLLMAAPGEGEQAIHLDRDDVAMRVVCAYTIILYCTSGQDSAAMPLFPLSEYAQPDFVHTDTRECRNAAQMRDTVASGKLEPTAYHRRPVQPGDILIFPQSTPHFGTRNNSIIPRVALFSVLTPFNEEEQDAFQLFRWLYVEAAYGVQSVELARVVYADRDHDPLGRFDVDAGSDEKKGGALSARDTYLACLLRWNFIRISDKAKKSFVWRPPTQHEKKQLSDREIAEALVA